MTGIFSISSYGCSDRGISRPINEDAYLLDDELGLYMVADGVGGLDHGDIASTMAIQILHEEIHAHTAQTIPHWESLFNKASQAIYQKSRDMGCKIGMGTTLTLLFIQDEKAHFAHVGDSSLYLFRKKEAPYKLTTEHTLGQELLSRSAQEELPYIPEIYMHSLTRCLGQEDFLEIDTGSFPIENFERILLTTDGVDLAWDAKMLKKACFQAKNPRVFVDALIQEANAAGGYDNTTAIAIFVDKA